MTPPRTDVASSHADVATSHADVASSRAHAMLQRARPRFGPANLRVGGAAALAVVLASLAMQPLLDGGWWIPRTVVVVAAITLAGALARAIRLPAPLQPLLQAITLLLSLTILFAGEDALWGVLPGPAALGDLGDLAAQGRAFADSTVAPAGPDTGLLLLIAAGIGLIALAVDTLAAGLDLPGLTLVPLASLFLVPWAINRGEAPGWTFVAVAVGWLTILSATQRDRAARWSPHARPGSAGMGLIVAAVTTVVALLAGGLANVGGAAQPIQIGTGTGGGSGPVEIDALVSLRRSLVSNDERVVMTLAATGGTPDYLRLAVLEDFDGEQWQPAPTTSLGPRPPSGPAGGAGSAPLSEYRIEVGPLSGTTVPSPSGTIQSLSLPVVWDQRTSLPLRSDGNTVEGERVNLVVAPRALDADALRAASLSEQAGYYPEDIADPEPLIGPELPELAREITAGAGSPFDAALALQRWFTNEGGFTYSTDVQAGTGDDALSTFLAERVGYCEQFSATMALMARALGIPARVVVGFTQGRREANVWVVRGTDAHAWPELWMGAAGWVRFEPTPGAPSTTTPSYTAADARPSGAPTAPSDAQTSAPTDQSTDPRSRVPELDELNSGEGAQSGGLSLRWIVLTGLLLVLLVPAAARWARRRRRMRIADGESTYRELADTLVDLGLGSEQATPRGTVGAARTSLAAVGPVDPEVQHGLDAILHAVEWQRYGSHAARTSESGPPAASEVPAVSRAAGGAAAVAVAEPTDPATTPDPSAPLRRSTRTVRRALARRAGWSRRTLAALAPQSVLRGLFGTR